jgi:hypothetical protein
MTTTDAAGPSPREQDEFIKVLAQGIWLYNPALLAGQAEEQARNIYDQLKRDWTIVPVEQRAGVVEIPLEDALALRLELMSPRVVRRNEAVQHRLERAIARASGDGQT